MCGIAGFFAPEGQSASFIKGMCDIINHRGPDDFGEVFFQTFDGEIDHKDIGQNANLAFGHRRLSIVDLSAKGHQPMAYKNYWITYNGEIYNYIELREELKLLGHEFISNSDTEVIVAAYDEWGVDCQHRFNGMWAFAIYDTKKKSVFLSRDRFGIKPLYYWVSPEGIFYFGSEIKQFTVLPQWKAVLNHQCAYDFLVWGVTDHTDETMFYGVHQLPPGHFYLNDLNNINLTASNKISSIKWYDLIVKKSNGSFQEKSEEFKRLLKDSVNIRLRADVSVGSCLSGGLDSSSIVCLMDQILKEKKATNIQKTFSACSKVESVNEKKWIDLVVEDTNVDAHYTYPEMQGVFENLSDITWHQDEPFGSTNIFAQWEVFALAREQETTVMLDGQGADEQLAGYHAFFGARLYDLLKRGRLVGFIREASQIHHDHGHSWFWILAQTSSNLLPSAMKNFLRKLVGRSHAEPDWLNFKDFNAECSNPHDSGARGVENLSYAQMTSTNLQMLLHWEDRDSMAHSIESRVPFLDYRLVEFVMNCSSEFKIKGSQTKRILREGMQSVIPAKIKNRMDKIGFATPEEVWIRQEAPEIFREKVEQAIEKSKGVINEDFLNLFDDIVAGRKPFNFVIWRIISFSEWMQVFDVTVDRKKK